MNDAKRCLTKFVLIGIIIVIIISPLFTATTFGLQTVGSESYLHTYINSPQGNFTYIDKPIFPVQINNSQIAIGQNWTIICPLQANHTYHIYCFGDWINFSSQAKTDYDILVYAPDGSLISTHTESAGLPEHLGTTVNDPFFVPTQSGNYTFVIINSLLDSHDAQEATFMIIENLQTDQWYTSYIDGNCENDSGLYSTWAYEFITNASHVALYVQVPGTLDMYEARLYLMNNAQSIKVNNVSLPWEPGLYGNLSSSVGGYNFNSTGYRGVAYASCEHNGQAMFLNYTTSVSGLKLYQVGLLGEYGFGNIRFMLKTDFENGTLIPINVTRRATPNNGTPLTFSTNETALETAQLSYSNDNWTNVNTVDMSVINQTCNATIPRYPAGSIIKYRVNATDTLMNVWHAEGNYTVKQPLALNITAAENMTRIGENITITGSITPPFNGSLVKIQFRSLNNTQNVTCIPFGNGTFVASFRPNSIGQWAVSAFSPETNVTYGCNSSELIITVVDQPVYVKYSLFIIAGLVAASVVGGVVYFFRFRKR